MTFYEIINLVQIKKRSPGFMARSALLIQKCLRMSMVAVAILLGCIDGCFDYTVGHAKS
jgi:hypothetical protein